MAAGRTMGVGGSRLATWACAGLVALSALAADAVAQTTQPAGSAGVESGLMTYIDPTFGFEMRVPVGWSYDRGRFEGPEGAIGVLRGTGPQGVGALEVLIFRSFEMSDFATWLRSFLKRLGEAHGGRKIPEEYQVDDTGERAVLLVDKRVGGRRAQTYYLCIPFDANTVWVLVFAGTVGEPAAEGQVRELFDLVAGSVRVLYDPVEAKKIAEAFERGMAVLGELRAGAAAVQIDETPQYYDLAISGKSVGYLRRRASRERLATDDPRFTSRRESGLRVREESWRFAEDGTVRHTELNMFSSHDLRSELIENRATQVPAPDVQSQRLFIELDQCIREGKTLVSSFSTNLDRDLPEPRPPLPIGPRYLDLAWVRLLPRLLLTAPRETYAFAVYDTQTRALGVYTIQPLGPCEIPGQPASQGFAYETREGYVSQPSRLYTDGSGQLVRIESGDVTITRVTKEQVDRKYADRREPGRRRMQAPRPATERP